MLDIILLKRFEKRPGHQKILKGEFAIEDGLTGRDVSRENEFGLCFRPGQKIDMSMIFSGRHRPLIFSGRGNINNPGPLCGTRSEAETEIGTQW